MALTLNRRAPLDVEPATVFEGFHEAAGEPTPRELLRLMARIREGDRREGILMRQGKGWFQVSCTGHETLAVLMAALRPDDPVFPYYRDRAVAAARGVSDREMALAFFAKADSSSGGRQMPGHFSDRARHIFSVATPTASQCLPAAGAAWGFQLDKTDRVAMTFLGDASTRQGEFYEALCFALQEKLPLVFVIEDNRYGISTPTERFFPYNLGALGEDSLVKVDGREPFELLAAARDAVGKARRGDGPTVLWVQLDRLCSHTSSDDQAKYRSADELATDSARDPLKRLADSLIARGELSRTGWDDELAAISREIDEIYRLAELAPEPAPDPMSHLFGPPVAATEPPFRFVESVTMVSAINETLRQALKESDRVVVFGEDVEDPKGGVFGLTKGLSREFPERIFNAPLAEATIVGAAVGLAATGFLPVFEIQFIDFLLPAMNQLVTNVGNLRWRTMGEWSCPMVLIAPYGAYLPGGSIWHSESNDGLWAHVHGLNVVVPGSANDAASLLWTAIHGNDPTLFLIPKHIFRKRGPAPPTPEALPLGRAAIRRAGTDITLVTFGNCLELADDAADRVALDGVSVEIIDLRSIAPLDMETIVASVSRTGRLVVVHEDSKTTGIGQAIVAEIVTDPDRFNLLFSAPRLVARKDTFIGFNPILEYAALPDVGQIVDALHAVLE